ncbi:glycerol-3-phosphate dehydrogenase/oxidase [Sphingobacterium psychroaquaticum]|uniref:glycerol-3-phosphate dehydrogenase/oxidase n=1 Tax=Sphingobacterium psychroaquaticum TaxID=561061 RepID=UPI001069559C|nr:glycerol-3-phosphate dehydrogenase/oxidase [Sphingobacterium psychroaquaticum]QBQ41970.1 glycerol-3-phosphate dehydrogenase/oxidase [Sphingobacterium psychroaquaticum]
MNFKRTEALKQVKTADQWDIAIIGGGATGLGIAVDAASRGYKTLLIEKYDFAKGTSSKSTKLVHGGVRYLANGDVKLVYSALKERGLLFKNAPHVSFVQSFVIPSYSFFGKMKFLIGLKMYDWMAGSLRIGKSSLLNKREVIEKLPKIKTKGLIGGIQYFDGQFDDARLAINLAQTAAEHGATVLNYTDVTAITKDDAGKVNGLVFTDQQTQEVYTIKSKAVINATGIFVDDILKLDTATHKNLVRPSQGAHIVVDKKFLGNIDALMIPETSDGRVLFGVPWHDKVLLGTTDTPLNEHQIEPRPLEEEITFILNTANAYLEHAPTRQDVLSIFAGLRPLAAPTNSDSNSTKEISRDHKLIKSPSNLVTITGGKWTTYRKMGEETVDFAIATTGLENKACKTLHLPIHGSTTNKQSGHWQVYGSDMDAITKLMTDTPALAEKIHEKYDFRMAEVVWACEHEMVVKLEDFLARRIRFLLLDAQASLEAAPKVAKLMAEQLNKNEDWVIQELEDYRSLVKNYTL